MPLPGILVRVIGRQPAPEDVHRRLRLCHGDAVLEPRLDEKHRPRRDAVPARRACPSACSAAIGSQKSVTSPMLSVALWPTGPTPTIVTGTPCIRMVRPMTDGSAPNLLVQMRWLMHGHDRRAAHLVLGENQRPSDG